MPSQASNIHEISVIVGLLDTVTLEDDLDFKFQRFSHYSAEYGHGRISITREVFENKISLFDRGLLLSKELINKGNLEGNNVRWTGLDEHTIDSSDIYSDGIGISLKDSSKIIRNNGFRQLLDTFCENPLRNFNDPFWEFAPSLSAEFISTVLKSCHQNEFLKIGNGFITIDDQYEVEFDGDIKELLSLNLVDYSELFTRNILKKLVREFSNSSASDDQNELLRIRTALADDVGDKVVGVLREGLLQSPEYVGDKIKHLLQYGERDKLFGFSCKNFIYVGNISSERNVKLKPVNIRTERSELSAGTTGLQVNLYTDIELVFKSIAENLTLQNQLRYKHRTFGCAPEANLHVLAFEDWRKIYPANL